MLLNELKRRNEVAIGTDKYNVIGNIQHTVCHHSYRDVHVGFLFFGARDCIMAVRVLYLLFKILTSDYLEAVTIY